MSPKRPNGRRPLDVGTDRRQLLTTLPVVGALFGLPSRSGSLGARGAPAQTGSDDDDREREERREAERAVRTARAALVDLETSLDRAQAEVDDAVEAFEDEDQQEGERALANVDDVDDLLGPLANDIEAVFENRGDRERRRDQAIEKVDEAIVLLEEVRDLVEVGNERFGEQTDRALASLDEVKASTQEANDAVRAALATELERDEREAMSDARRAVRTVDRNCRDAARALEDNEPEEARRLLREADRQLQAAIEDVGDL